MPPTFVAPSAVLPRWYGRSAAHFVAPGLLYTAALSRSEEKRLPEARSRPMRSRKLLASDGDGTHSSDQSAAALAPAPLIGGGNNSTESRREYQVQRMGPGEGRRSPASSCSTEDITIVQGEMGPMPDGIPSFAVQILNLCLEGCPIADIHVSCGWFASATLVNPALFKRVGFDDCLVKEGHALQAGETLTFQYANSFQYPFSLSSASFTCP
ncbi:hypothetical protein L7F22_036818 [Adiantum nelumboides]|nr:hypothetical protein [Adiantum nelumboides]